MLVASVPQRASLLHQLLQTRGEVAEDLLFFFGGQFTRLHGLVQLRLDVRGHLRDQVVCRDAFALGHLGDGLALFELKFDTTLDVTRVCRPKFVPHAL